MAVVGQAAERDRHLHRPPVGQDAGLGAPQCVPFVQNAAVVLEKPFAAGAERIDVEGVAIAARHVGIEVDTDEIVAVQGTVAPFDAREDAVRLIVIGHDGDIEIVLVVEDADGRALTAGCAFVGVRLVKLVDDLRLAPNWVGEIAVDGRRLRGVDSRRLGGRPIGRKVADRRCLGPHNGPTSPERNQDDARGEPRRAHRRRPTLHPRNIVMNRGGLAAGRRARIVTSACET